MRTKDIGEWSDMAVDKLTARLKNEAMATPGLVITAMCGAWSVCFSQAESYGSIFSARTQRSTKDRDWNVLGKLVVAIGAPSTSEPSTIETDPDATHYWVWGGSVSAEEIQKTIDSARTTLTKLRS